MNNSPKMFKCALITLLLIVSPSAWGFYDSSLGRWINRDPRGEWGFELLGATENQWLQDQLNGFSSYAFVNNSPNNYVDAVGLSPIPPNWGLAPPGKMTPEEEQAFKDAVQRYVNYCKSCGQPQRVDCDTICQAFFGNVFTPLLAACTESCEECNLHDLGSLKEREKELKKKPKKQK